MRKPVALVILSVFPVVLHGCISDPVALPAGAEMKVLLHVTGGFAGADYFVLLDGGARTIVGVSCVSQCEFQDGEVLQTLTPGQVDYFWGLFHDAGVLALDGRDFGTQCCDQFYFDLDYRDDGGRSRLKGSSEALPQELRVAISALQGLVSEAQSVIVAFDTSPDLWPRDAFQIQEASVQGQNLQVTMAYGGGCRVHDVKSVAWGGWMESNPVQVRVFLSHEDFDDPCDAWVTREVTFNLIPLKLSYEKSYGVAEPGATTLILLLEDPMLASPQGARWLEYRF